MILDERLELCDADDVFSTGSTVLSENVIDLESARDIGQGHPLYLCIQVTTAFAGGTSAQFTLASDAAAAIDTGGTASEHVKSAAIAVASLTAGARFVFTVPPEGIAYERYLGLLVTCVGTVTAGAVDAFLTFEPTGWQAQPDAGIN